MPTFTKATTILNIGHLPGHTQGKEALLREAGYTSITSILCESTPVEQVKALLKAAATPEGALFLVGGAMMRGFPDLMKDLLDFVAAECPTILVHKTSGPDFDPECVLIPAFTDSPRRRIPLSPQNPTNALTQQGDLPARPHGGAGEQVRAQHLQPLPGGGEDLVRRFFSEEVQSFYF